MAETVMEVIIAGLGYAESPRWHEESVWFSDFHTNSVHRAYLNGTLSTVAVVPARPAGLGFTPDGTPLVVSAHDQKLSRIVGDCLSEVADLSTFVTGPANDMVVDSSGRAYIGAFGYDLIGGEAPRASKLVLVAPDGTVSVAANDLLFPNGLAITAGGDTLIVAETNANRLTAFDIGEGGTLSRRRVFATFDDAGPDGICIDVEGAVWAAVPLAHEFRRVTASGRVTDRISTPGKWAVACALGGSDRQTLIGLTADTDMQRLRSGEGSTSFVEVASVGVPGP